MAGGAAAEPFGVNVEGQKELLLEVDELNGSNAYAHADWVSLSQALSAVSAPSRVVYRDPYLTQEPI